MGNETQKNEFSYAENDSATPCCKINQQNVQFLHWVVTSFNFKYFVPKFKTVFINYSPQTSFVNNVLQMFNNVECYYIQRSLLLFYCFPQVLVLRKNDGNQGLLALELRGQNQ